MSIIKEVAPIKGAATDAELGVGDFQRYFKNLPIYMDSPAREFFYAFGDRKVFSSSLVYSWNPLTYYRDFTAMTGRMKEKNIEGNLVGEGNLKGGIMIIHPKKGITFLLPEETGSDLPYDEIQAAVDSLVARDGGDAPPASAVSGTASEL